MIDRLEQERREETILSPHACRAAESRGRRFYEEPCALRTCFQRDRDRIIHSKSFRRLMHKTQVFLAPEGDHYRTRLTHTLEVSQIARTIARGLALNEDLTEAIALGHDLGHTPFGHNGEAVLNEIHPGGFAHNEQSLRVVDVLERHHGRQGMNLTWEVRDGILHHTGEAEPLTLEGQIVRISDRIAYINHDIDDALRSGVITQEELPADCIEHLGAGHSARISTLVSDMIRSSDGAGEIRQSEEAEYYMNALRAFMFVHVYRSENVKKASDLEKVRRVITGLYRYYVQHPECLPGELRQCSGTGDRCDMARDYVAGMTDRYAVASYESLFVR
ncbi:MAG: deoxyguanosinetriphosphate triphosphohydrolase [Anaerovoracaceae bacterium]|jgi:dGTPase